MVQSKYIYLHGFASSPHGSKAQYLSECLESLQIHLTIPDLNQGDFTHLTLTRQLEFIQDKYLHQPSQSELEGASENSSDEFTLIGSSFGGLTSAILAERNLEVKRLVLLAPAFQFHIHLSRLLGSAKMQQWQTDGFLDFPHYGENCDLPLNYNFWTDLVQYRDEEFSREVPTLILHGIHDDVISIKSSEEFASQRPWVELRKLDSDHSLGNVVVEIWQTIQEFCHI